MYLICTILTTISALVSLGFASQAYFQSRGNDGVALTNAKYALSRSTALVIAACGLLGFHDSGFLVALAIVMVAGQLFDGIIGKKISTFKTVGPLLTAAINAIVLFFYLMQ